jgi:hypothetical protein
MLKVYNFQPCKAELSTYLLTSQCQIQITLRLLQGFRCFTREKQGEMT